MTERTVEVLRTGGVGLVPTDTIYGISCSAYDERAVERIYDVKGRDRKCPLIILISDISDLKAFRIALDRDQESLLSANWPDKISFILPVNTGFDYLTRGSTGLAFRMPADDGLLNLLRETGPLVSTSANPTGDKPASTVAEAKAYFGDNLDFYMDSGELISEPSTLVDLTAARPVVLRQGAAPFRINK